MEQQQRQQQREKNFQLQGPQKSMTQQQTLQASGMEFRLPVSALRKALSARVISILGVAACLRLTVGSTVAAAATPDGTTAVGSVHSQERSVPQHEKGSDNMSHGVKYRDVLGRKLIMLASHDVPAGPPDKAESSSAAPDIREAAEVSASEWLAAIGGTGVVADSTGGRNDEGGDNSGDAILASPQVIADPEGIRKSAEKMETPHEGPKPAEGRRRENSASMSGQRGVDVGVVTEALRSDGKESSKGGRGRERGDNSPVAPAKVGGASNALSLGKQQLPLPTEKVRGFGAGQREGSREQDGIARGGERVEGKRMDGLEGDRKEEGDAGELQAGARNDGIGMVAVSAKNETESLVAVKVGLNSLRTIETEVEKHVEELLGLFSGGQGGGQKYKAAALGVQHEVDDIRQELVKLLKTINSTNDGILGAENEIQKKDAELEELLAIEEAEGAKGKLDDGNMKVDYVTGKIRWDEDGDGANNAAKNGGSHETARKKVESMKEEWDPALLHLNPTLLGDFVIFCMSAALGGILAAWVGLPETLGYIAGGMAVGRSGANLIRMVKEVHTFSQFGSIFLLFGHGLLYSTLFHAAAAANSTVYAQQGRMGAFTVLFVVFSALLVCAAMIGIDEVREGIFLSAAATLSSTAMVTEFVAHRRLGDTVFARMVVDLVAVQDFIMCPLLAIPTAIISFQESEGTGWLFPRVAGCAILLTGVFLASRRLLPLAMKRLVLSDNEKEQSSLFTLGVVSYCVGLALVCERLNLSHEAGALFAGLLMADSPFAKRAHACMQPLTSLFGGMYLGSLGMIVSPSYMVWHLGDVLGCVFLLVLIKFIVVATVMKSFGFSWEASTLAGACMAQVSEISLFFSARAVHLKLIGRDHYLIAVATTIILMVASPMVITALQTYHKGGVGSGRGGGGGVGREGDFLPSALKGVAASNGVGDGGSGGMTGDGARLGGGVDLGAWRSPRNRKRSDRKKEEDEDGRGKESTAMTPPPSALATAAVDEEEGGAVHGGGRRRGGWLSRSSGDSGNGGGGGSRKAGERTTRTRRRFLLV